MSQKHSIRIELECGGCQRMVTLGASIIAGVLNMPAIIAGLGWGQYMRGVLLCSECVQNTSELERVDRIATSAGRVIEKPIEVEINGHSQNDHSYNGQLSDNVVEKRAYRRFTDEQVINADTSCGGVKARAASLLGIQPKNFYSRLKRAKQNFEAKTQNITIE